MRTKKYKIRNRKHGEYGDPDPAQEEANEEHRREERRNVAAQVRVLLAENVLRDLPPGQQQRARQCAEQLKALHVQYEDVWRQATELVASRIAVTTDPEKVPCSHSLQPDVETGSSQ